MAISITNQLLAKLGKLVASLIGLHFPENRLPDLMRFMTESAREFGFTDMDAFVECLMLSPMKKNFIEKLASHFTIGETYFFRENESFRVLEEQILPALIQSRQECEKCLRIWSAGCSTGEEAYSIAIMLSRMIADRKDWNITILATDINPNSLKKASEGRFNEWSFRSTPLWVKEGYFKRIGDGCYEIHPAIKSMVMFEYLNLVEDVYPLLFNNTNVMDLIFCRNVLMYFAPERAEKVVRGFYNTLVDNGWLVVSPAEAIKSLYPRFITTNFPGATLYRKPGTEETASRGDGGKRKDEWESGIEGDCGIINNDFYNLQLSKDVSISADSMIPPFSDSEKSEERTTTEQRQTPYEDALILYNQGQYAAVEKKLSGLLLHDQDNPRVLTLLSRTCANQGKFDDAVKWCEKAVAADKLNPGNYYHLATIQLEKGCHEEAIALLKNALYLDPDFVLAYFVLGNLMMRQGKYKTSRKYLDNAFDLSSAYGPDEILPESEGITAGRLMEIVAATAGRKLYE